MTTNNDIELSTADDGLGNERPRQTFGWSEAKQAGLTTHEIFMLVTTIFVVVVDFHRRVRTPRDRWEPTDAAGHMLGLHYVRKAIEELEQACRDWLDPVITKIADLGAELEEAVRNLSERDEKLTSSETGMVYTEAEAVTQVEHNRDRIDADSKRGLSHHERVRGWVRVLGKVMPYGEALGLVVLLTFWLNVDWTRPWIDTLTWTLSVVVVLATLLFTPRVIERAAQGWNKRRQADAEKQADIKKAATRKFLINGAIATIISVTIVAGLVERALTVVDSSLPQSMLVLIIALCIIAGLAMPAVAAIAIAWDGSSYSRENDDLIEQLDLGRSEDQELRSAIRSLSEACEQEERRINTDVAPAIRRIAVDIVEEARRAYAWLRVQIGALPAAPPPRPEEPLHQEFVTSIDFGIPGAEPMPLESLVSRGLRIQELARKRMEMMAKLDAAPQHPWSGNEAAV